MAEDVCLSVEYIHLCLLLGKNTLAVNMIGSETILFRRSLLIFMTLQEFRIPTAVKRHVVFFVGTLSFNHTSSYFLDFASVIVLSETVCELAVIVDGL